MGMPIHENHPIFRAQYILKKRSFFQKSWVVYYVTFFRFLVLGIKNVHKMGDIIIITLQKNLIILKRKISNEHHFHSSFIKTRISGN